MTVRITSLQALPSQSTFGEPNLQVVFSANAIIVQGDPKSVLTQSRVKNLFSMPSTINRLGSPRTGSPGPAP